MFPGGLRHYRNLREYLGYVKGEPIVSPRITVTHKMNNRIVHEYYDNIEDVGKVPPTIWLHALDAPCSDCRSAHRRDALQRTRENPS